MDGHGGQKGRASWGPCIIVYDSAWRERDTGGGREKKHKEVGSLKRGRGVGVRVGVGVAVAESRNTSSNFNHTYSKQHFHPKNCQNFLSPSHLEELATFRTH